MKEILQPKKDITEIAKQAKKDIQKVLIGSQKPQKNHILFEVNIVENTIKPAKFDRNTTITFVDAMLAKKENKSVSVKKDCIYISALNKKNVLKILKRDY